MSYKFQAGTIPLKCWEHLKTLPVGHEISTAELAGAIGQPGVKLGPYLVTAQRHGALRMTKRGKLSFWSVGDGKPATVDEQLASDDDDDDPPDPARRPVVKLSARSIFDQAAALEHTSPRRSLNPEPALSQCASTRKPPALQSLRVALWSDGTLELNRGPDDVVLLTVDETRQLVAYLDRMAVAE